eukprot:gene810-1287_t
MDEWDIVTHIETQGYELFSVDIPSLWIAYAVGEKDTISKSVDQGATWVSTTSGLGTRYTWNSVSFASTTTGYVAGRFAKVVKTVDGGDTWAEQLTPLTHGLDLSTAVQLQGIAAASVDLVVAVGTAGAVVRTEDGGATWTVQYSGTQDSLYAVHYVGDATFFAAGANGRILRSSSSGLSWSNVANPLRPNFESQSFRTLDLNSVYFSESGSYGWAAGEAGVILYSENAGASWTRLAGCGNLTIQDITVDVFSGHGWVVGLGGLMCYSDDGGVSWEFDGVDDMLLLPLIYNIRTISVWVYRDADAVQTSTPAQYLLDARAGLPEGYFTSVAIGQDWTAMFVNA